MERHLRLSPGQEMLTPAQVAEAVHFADERIRAQLSTEPVDEQVAEAWLRQAYEEAGLAPPQRIHWLDGPNQRDAVLAAYGAGISIRKNIGANITSVWDRLKGSIRSSMRDRLKGSIRGRVWAGLRANVRARIRASVWDRVGASIGHSIWSLSFFSEISTFTTGWDMISAYEQASWLVFAHFFAVYLAPNEFGALARFNELVSEYWLGSEAALIVRRPRVLALDAVGRLHSASGRCIEYRDGQGGYAWHGVAVPKKIILAPEALTREDFLNELNTEVRRVIQERMGEQFMAKVGGVVLDSGHRGTLYEVVMPPPPEPWMRWDRVAHYVQLQDASTERQYFLRVPPTIQTAAEAVAWSFQLTVEEYHPAHET